MTKPVVASVSEPSKPGDFFRDFDRHWKEARDAVRRAEKSVRGDITIPGDDAPPATANGWRPASEPPDSDRMVIVMHKHGHEACAAYYENKSGVGVWHIPFDYRQEITVTHWHELPEPPR